MDIFAHGLWTHALYETFARAKKKPRTKRDIWLPIFFGIAPDLFSFGIFFVQNIFSGGIFAPFIRMHAGPDGMPTRELDPSLIPHYVHVLYSYTHSIVIFGIVFLAVWLVRKRKSFYWPMAAWAFHIGIDIWSHTDKFFPTPVLFPISNWHFSGISWGDPVFMFVNYMALLAVYLVLYIRRIKKAPLN